MRWCILQPGCLRLATPLGEQLAQFGIVELLLAGLKVRLLQPEPCVVDKAARACEAAHLLALRGTGAKFELEALQAFHEPMIRWVHAQMKATFGTVNTTLSSY